MSAPRRTTRQVLAPQGCGLRRWTTSPSHSSSGPGVMAAGSVLRRAGEGEGADPDGRDQHGHEPATQELAIAADRLDAGERIEVALCEAQVAHRPHDLAVLDQERAVAGHACDDSALGMDDVRV